MGATGRRLGSGQVSLGGLGLRTGGSYWPTSRFRAGFIRWVRVKDWWELLADVSVQGRYH